MRLLPRSLFSRLVVVLLAGLVIAQLASFWIHMHERGELLAQASGMQSAQRIADTVKLLDTLGPEERRRIVKVFSAPPLVINLDEAPLKAQDGAAESGARAALFGAMLRRYLGDDRQVLVARTAAALGPSMQGGRRGFRGGEMHGGWTPPWGGMHGASTPGLAFTAQVRLRDGVLVTFQSRVPGQTESWPYRLLGSVAVLLIAVVALSWLAVRWATRPLNALADAAEQLGRNINRAPMEEKGPIEVVRAARAFNTMQSHLLAYVRERTRLLAAMSHDLKTPVTRLRLRAELLEDAALRRRFEKDLDEMEAMVGATLDFLRGMEDTVAFTPVDVMALLESLQADMREAGAQVEISGAAIKPYPGNAQALKRCFGNLFDNAVKYGKAASILVDDSEERLEVRIVDEGPGLPPAELERVFEPFYRVEGSRSRDTGGTGLGLAIARSVAEAHGGRVVLRNRAEGGLEVVLTLPRPPVAAQ